MTYTSKSQMALACRACARRVHRLTALMPRWFVCDECKEES